MYKIKIGEEVLSAVYGELLSDVLIKSGKSVEHPCGGRGTCKKCIVTVNGKKELSCQYKVESDISVEFTEAGEIISENGVFETYESSENLCYVLDIGTTTLAMALVSLDNGKIIKAVTRNNPQRAFGADVMSRIGYCMKYGVSELQCSIVSVINSMISQFEQKNIEKLYIAGNTTMLHLLFGVDCSSMGVAPYTSCFLESRTESAEKTGIENVETLISLPSVSTFVGADIVAGLNFSDMPENGKYSLLIDLGTNAEIVLFSQKSAVCTAAAAGPCFEGANISCGMSATEGAVYSVTGKKVKTVGNVPASGICGTGLIDIIAFLLDEEIIDETGFMECEEFEIANGVFLTQNDIRQYQLAKSAVYSAIITLIRIKGIKLCDIDKMYISGGFAAEINIENAVRTGLLPEELKEKCISLKNSSLLGTVKFAFENNDLTVFTDNTSYIDLSSSSDFSELFINNMMFE